MYNYKHYTVADGFPQSNADDIFQDKDGYIWFATQNGAARFDGFKYFMVDKYKGLNSNNVTDINQDSKGNFWFSTKDGLTKYVNDSCINYTEEDGLSSNIVRNTFELPDGRILILTNAGTDIFENNKIRDLNLSDIPVFACKRKNGDILLLSENCLYRFAADTLQKINLPLKVKDAEFRSVAEDADFVLWIASNKGIFKFKDGKITHMTVKDGLSSNDIRHLLIDSENNLWYASEQNGCGKYFDGTFYNLTAETGMTNTAVLSLFEDNEKNIWIGGRNGATMINPRIPFIQFENLSPYKNEIVMGITEDTKGNLWFCTYGAGLSEYDGKKFINHNKLNGAFDNHFFDAETDTEGNLWIATANSGILKYDGKKFTVFENVEGEKIKSRVVTAFKDSKNNIWFGTNGEGLIKYDGKKFIRFKNHYDFNVNTVLGIEEDNDGNLWFATLNEGLYFFDGKKVINTDEKFKIKSGILRAVVEYKNMIWLGTASEGIFRLKNDKGKIRQEFLNKSKGLNSDNVYLLFADSEGYLWCGTEKGVDKIFADKNGNILSIKNYTKDEGFLGVETDLNGACEDKAGNIWFGTVNGAVKYSAGADKKNNVEPKIYITDIRLNFKTFDKTEFCDSSDNNNLPVNLVLPYDMNHLTFDFIGLCYSNPQKVRYKYRLIGQSDEMSPPSSDRKATFSNIAPGHYIFEVIAANDDGLWSKEPLRFSFVINPPVWDQLWFKTLGLFILLVLIYIFVEYRNRSLKNAKRKLEETISERTAELKIQKEKLQNTNIKITDSINYAGKIQKALMPSDELFKNNFSDSFILYMPRDIVSGDFYWAKEIERGYDSYIVIVAADSTGHGIPGALVSMLGMSLLNEIVRKEEVGTPDKILEELRKEIKSSLKQNNEIDDMTEGIDMAIAVINKHTKEMFYAGANNPLYIIRNDELIILKPTINPVGIFLKELPFKNYFFQLKKNDAVYMFSDGFEDQFNGITGEKFKIKRFRELLLKIYKEDCETQKRILQDEFFKWKGNYEQIDDVLIVGFKV